MLKIAIVLLLIAVLISLASGLFFLYKDQDKTDSRRTLYSLGLRILLASSLIGLIFYGLYTGALTLKAPWHQGHQETSRTNTLTEETEAGMEADKKPSR